jgi:hypothetical protein
MKSLKIAFLIIFCSLISRGWYHAKNGFSLSSIETNLQGNPDLAGTLPPEDALMLTYSYLGRGRQCYAFASSDGRYVLKLPRYDRTHLPLWLKSLPWLKRMRQRKMQKCTAKNQFFHASLRLANEKLKKETGLIYLHLDPTTHLKRSIKIQNRLSQTYFIPLDTTAFAIQEKAPLMIPALQREIEKKNAMEAKKILRSFLRLIQDQAEKGVCNVDTSISKNFAIQKGTGLEIDLGSFYQPINQEESIQSIKQMTSKLKSWLDKKDPDLALWFASEAASIYEN